MWKIAGVQMDCRFADKPYNLEQVRIKLREAAGQGARLVVFPECILTGYGYDGKEQAWPHAETVPGPSSELLARDCAELGVWAAVGALERVEATNDLFNVCFLVGPSGLKAVYRKIHLPFLGVDRFTTPGDRPFAVHDLGGLRVGMTICYDGGFPESARCLALLGADLVILPTNWPSGAISTVKYLVQARALENHIYFMPVNRIGEEGGFRFIGQSRIIEPNGELAAAAGDGAEILYAEIDPERARVKRIVHVPGKYELDRIADRRPELYGPLVEPLRPERRVRRGS